jgi:hypothetical protein
MNYSLAIDESRDTYSTAQICVFACGATFDSEPFEELVDLH